MNPSLKSGLERRIYNDSMLIMAKLMRLVQAGSMELMRLVQAGGSLELMRLVQAGGSLELMRLGQAGSLVHHRTPERKLILLLKIRRCAAVGGLMPPDKPVPSFRAPLKY